MPLRIELPEVEAYDEENDRFFILYPKQTLTLEHSLISLSKWEAKWKKPFLMRGEKTVDETIDYIRCMTLTQNVPESTFTRKRLTNDVISKIEAYMNDPMTATVFSNKNRGASRETYTAEIIYYYMLSYGIPIEMQKWHLRRLLTLIRVFSEKNQKPKKTSQAELIARQAAINERNKKYFHTTG